jgi:hypothetical protein
VVVEANTHITDVGRRFRASVPVFEIDVRSPRGWYRFADICEEHPGSIIVANLPSDVAGAFPEDRTGAMNAIRKMLGVRVILAWVLNHEVDGIIALRREMKRSQHPISDLVVIPNLHHTNGKLDLFAWMRSQTRSKYIEYDLLELAFPALWPEVARIYRQIGVSFEKMRAGEACDPDGQRYPAGVRLTLYDWFRRTDLVWDTLADAMGWRLPEATSREPMEDAHSVVLIDEEEA